MGNPICHFEIGGRDLKRSRAFYENLFDWDMRPDPGSIHVKTGDDVGGHLTEAEGKPYVTFYVMVDDLEKSLEEAVALGGRVVLGITDERGHGQYAWIADPDDNVIGLYMEY